ncbi:hypothetical protein KDK77_06520 [bacterium]|nr:hypothetical protein [bacterium]MCP5461673.1 hypothetical protein [bacterium]
MDALSGETVIRMLVCFLVPQPKPVVENGSLVPYANDAVNARSLLTFLHRYKINPKCGICPCR